MNWNLPWKNDDGVRNNDRTGFLNSDWLKMNSPEMAGRIVPGGWLVVDKEMCTCPNPYHTASDCLFFFGTDAQIIG